MTNLIDDMPRLRKEIPAPLVVSHPCAASATVYAGAAVEEQGDGGVANLLGTGTTFVGIAMHKCVNSGAIAGAPRVEVLVDGIVQLPVAVSGNVARTTLGATVYATDGNAFTTTSTSAQAIGKVVEVPEDQVGLATGYLWVRVTGIPARHL